MKNKFICSSLQVLLATMLAPESDAFSMLTTPQHPVGSVAVSVSLSSRRLATQLYYTNPTDAASLDETQVQQISDETAAQRPKLPNLVTALTARDFARHVPTSRADAPSQSSQSASASPSSPSVVIVRYYASWCNACKRAEPHFLKLARENPHIKFVQVPILSSNSDLLEQVGVETIPWGQIYTPNHGLVTESKMNTKNFPAFRNLVAAHGGV